jgi:hypothetical protein
VPQDSRIHNLWESPDSLTPEHALAGIVELKYDAPLVPGAYRSGKIDDVVSAEGAMLQHEAESPLPDYRDLLMHHQ